MLIPKRVKYRRQHRPHRTGVSKGGNKITFGDYGLQALEPAYITNRQIESARIAINRAGAKLPCKVRVIKKEDQF